MDFDNQKELQSEHYNSDLTNDSLEKNRSRADNISLTSLVLELNNFLKTGTFSWRFSSNTIAQFEERFISLFKKINGEYYETLEEIYVTLISSNYALTRLQNQFSTDFITFLITPIPMQMAFDDLKKANLKLDKSSFEKLQILLALWNAFS